MLAVCPRRGIRLAVDVLAAGVLAMCVTASPARAQSASADSISIELAGRIVDERTDIPLAGAIVSIFDRRTGRRIALAESGPAGGFRLGALAPGLYAVHVQRLGYVAVLEDLHLAGGESPVLLTASLSPEAVSIDPVEVTVERQGTVAMREFEQRRAIGLGSFVTRADIDERSVPRVTDLLRSMPGVRIASNREGDGVLVLRGRCRPAIYIDGMATDPAASLDFSLRPDDVEGIEIYSSDAAPVQYARNACGVVLVWTRVPVRGTGRGGWWKPLAVVGGIFTTLILVR